VLYLSKLLVLLPASSLPLFRISMVCICVGVERIPAASTVHLTMLESPRYSTDVEKDIEKANLAVARATDSKFDENQSAAIEVTTIAKFITYFSHWQNLRVLISISMTWFLLDNAFCGISLNQPYVLNAMGFVGDGSI
ncbi:Inorganic phosphate transporter pho84, partial [Mortierella sp. AM989]